MKVKTLKTIRKYWEYTFCKGKLYMRRKVDGKVREFDSIQQFVSFYIYENIGIMSGLSWNKHKRAIADKRKWEQVQTCS